MRGPQEFEVPLCAQVGGELFFPENEGTSHDVSLNTAMAKKICHNCQHRIECAEWGINKEYFGIWGGLTLRERQQIRRQKNIILGLEQSA